MPILQRPTAALYYEVLGETGPWLTLVNGHTRSSRDFKLLAKVFVAAGFRCLIFDNRGSGQTSEEGPIRLDDMVEDILALWTHCRVKRSHLMGISMGGIVSQFLAARNPQLIDHLVLVSTAASSGYLASLSFEPWGRELPEVESRLKKYVSAGFYARNKLLMQAMAKQILTAIQSDGFESRATAQHLAIAGFDTRDLLPRIAAPTLIIHGTDDTVIPLAAASEIAALIPGARLQLVAEGGHLLLAEDSKRLGQMVIDFCAKT